MIRKRSHPRADADGIFFFSEKSATCHSVPATGGSSCSRNGPRIIAITDEARRTGEDDGKERRTPRKRGRQAGKVGDDKAATCMSIAAVGCRDCAVGPGTGKFRACPPHALPPPPPLGRARAKALSSCLSILPVGRKENAFQSKVTTRSSVTTVFTRLAERSSYRSPEGCSEPA